MILEEWVASARFVFAPASAGMIWPMCRGSSGERSARPRTSVLSLKESASEALMAAVKPFHFASREQPRIYCSVTRVETMAPCGRAGQDAAASGQVFFSTTSDFLSDDNDFVQKMQEQLLTVPWSYGGQSAYISLSALFSYRRPNGDIGL